MARHKTWVGILSDFVRKNPRTSAMIAFNLGVWAGQTTKHSLGRTDLKHLPSKLVDMVPSMSDIGGYVPALPSPGKRKSAAKSAAKTARRRKSTAAKAARATTTRRRKRRAA
jgi:hypothetical protein